MTQDEIAFQKLRDCFNAGYSMPQWCVDSGYKRPLFVAYDENFLWELYVQFRFCKINNLEASFMMLKRESLVNYSQACTINGIKFIIFDGKGSTIEKYDVIICLTMEKQSIVGKNIVYLDRTLSLIANYVFAERPIYKYIADHPGVKVITYSAPHIIKNEYMSEQEKIYSEVSGGHIRNEILNNPAGNPPVKTPLDCLGYSNEQVAELLSMPNAITDQRGCTKFVDRGGYSIS